MRTEIGVIHAALAFAVLTAAPAGAQWQAPTNQDLQALVDARVASGVVTGLVVGVIDGGTPRSVSAGDFGSAARPHLFEIGSISKVFTTVLLADMVLRGEVALDDPVQRYLPGDVKVPERSGKAITLLDLATSTSGLPRVPDLEPRDSANPYVDFAASYLYAWLGSHELERDPGASYEYSNLGMGLLGHALALRSGASYEELVRERILLPLGMLDTWIVMPPDARQRLVPGHDYNLDPTGAWDFDVLAGAGGWRSTTHDMLRFLAAAVSPPSSRLGEAMRMTMKSRRPTGAAGLSIGLGWHIITRGDGNIVWHNGQTGGFHSFIGFDPATGANVLVLSNTATDIDDLGLHVIDSTVPLRRLPPTQSMAGIDSTVLQRLVGKYQLTPAFAITVIRSGEALYAQATGQPKFRLFPSSPTRFFLRVVEAELEFELGDDGDAVAVILYQGGQSVRGARQM